jgi:hypothetical protein
VKTVAILLFLSLSLAWSDDQADITTTVQKFYDAYVKQLPRTNGYEGTIAWVNKSSRVTPEYKTALAKLYRDALKEDPDYGYGADAVIAGNDWPDAGFAVRRVWLDGPRAFVFLSGRDSGSLHQVNVRVVKKDGKWLIDGSGPVDGGIFDAERERLTDDELGRRLIGLWKTEDGQIRFKPGGPWRINAGFLSLKPGDREPRRICVINKTSLILEENEGALTRMERVE